MHMQYYRTTLEFTAPILGTVPTDRTTWELLIRPKSPYSIVMDEEAETHPSPRPENGDVYTHEDWADVESAKDRGKEQKKRDKALNKAARQAKRQAEMGEEDETDTPMAKGLEKPQTSFFRDDQGPFLFNYQVMGHLKEMGNVTKGAMGIVNLKQKVENYCYVFPRRIHFQDPVLAEISRPLRAETMQGPRVAIATSDAIREGSRITLTIGILDNRVSKKIDGKKTEVVEITPEVVREFLAMGQIRGMGQWRTGGWGTYRVLEWEPVTNEAGIRDGMASE